MLLTRTKNHYSHTISGSGISSFNHSYSNNSDHLHHRLESSPISLTDPNYLQNQGSNLHTKVETEAKVTPKSPLIKRILLVDDDPDVTLTFKAGLDGHYYSEKKRFEVCTYNDPLLVVKEFKPHFYDLLLTDIYMPNVNGFELCEGIRIGC
jgi:PleD family two-component response regulator